jgi:hypothetical protein
VKVFSAHTVASPLTGFAHAQRRRRILDTFDLRWPRADATLYTDGWRCRIVWRERRGGLGGSIDNNEQCKRRIADSLGGAPYLLGALRARGHGLLASEIEMLAAFLPTHQRPTAGARSDSSNEGLHSSAGPDPALARIRAWVGSLDGDAGWEAAENRRASHWSPCLDVGDEALLLKAPAPKGRREWALKRTWPAEGRRKAEYVVARDLRGICTYLVDRGVFADPDAVEAFLSAAGDLQHPELSVATNLWRDGFDVTH